MPDRFIDVESDRRTFLKRGLLAGGALALSAAGAPNAAQAGRPSRPHSAGAGRGRGRVRGAGGSRRAPNILVVLVNQLRAPAWAPASPALDALLPNIAALRGESVSFEGHYAASNDCSPSRGTLLTGLYSHQTGCMITGRSRLSPGFPTWGTLLRDLGYETTWWGKWHLNPDARASLEPYGFSGGTYPSPNGSPGQGTEVNPTIVDQFEDWFDHESGNGPWCTTVSLVNPHDIAWWYRYTSEIPGESEPPGWVGELPPNFETPGQLLAAGKPLLHRSLQETAARSFGAVPFTGPEALGAWSGLMNTYLLLQTYVNRQLGRVLAKLAGRPRVSANTVIVFTSDHGEYGGAHGMRGKGASAYEEAIHVPLYVNDRRGIATAAPGVPRSQLSSSVNIVPLLLSLATGSNAWRAEKLATPSRRPRRPRRDLRRRGSARPALGAARHRRGRDRVRERSPRCRSAPPRGRAAHRGGQAGAVFELGRGKHRGRDDRPGSRVLRIRDRGRAGGARERGRLERARGRAAGDARNGRDPERAARAAAGLSGEGAGEGAGQLLRR